MRKPHSGRHTIKLNGYGDLLSFIFKGGKIKMAATIPLENHRFVAWRQVIRGREIWYEVTVDDVVVFETDSYGEGLYKYEKIGVEEGQFGTYEDGSARTPYWD